MRIALLASMLSVSLTVRAAGQAAVEQLPGGDPSTPGCAAVLFAMQQPARFPAVPLQLRPARGAAAAAAGSSRSLRMTRTGCRLMRRI